MLYYRQILEIAYYAITAVAIANDVKYICNGVAALSSPSCTVDCTPPGLAVIAAYTAFCGDVLPAVTVGTTTALGEVLHPIEITLPDITLACCAPPPAPAAAVVAYPFNAIVSIPVPAA